jgi:hypothetical protein
LLKHSGVHQIMYGIGSKAELDHNTGAATNGKEFRGRKVGRQVETWKPIDLGSGGRGSVEKELVV